MVAESEGRVGVDDSSTLTGWVARRQSAPLECGNHQLQRLGRPEIRGGVRRATKVKTLR